MPMYDADDIVDVKNRKKRRKRLIKMSAILLLLCVIAALLFTREKWLPKLRGIGKQYQTIVNSGKLAEGNYPLEVGNPDYQMCYSVKKIMVLSDTYLYYYDIDGTLLKKRQHAYNKPMLEVANGRALVYESGGNEYSFEDEEEVFYSKTYDEEYILFARLSSEGYTAAVTTCDNYSCRLWVYDKKGRLVYDRKCIEHVSDVNFIDGSAGCVLSYIKAENGKLTTHVQELDFKEKKEKWTSPGLNTLGLEIRGSSEGAFVYGLDACGYVDKSGQIATFYTYDGEFADAASMSGRSVVLVNNKDARKYTAALFAGSGEDPVVIDLDSPGMDATVFGGLALIMTKDKINAYDFDGTLRSTASISDSYTGFVKSDDHIFLKGYNKIDRIDYDTGNN